MTRKKKKKKNTARSILITFKRHNTDKIKDKDKAQYLYPYKYFPMIRCKHKESFFPFRQ